MAPAVQTEALEQIVLRRKGVGTPISRAIAVSIQHVTSREGRDKTDFPPSTLLGMVFFPRRRNAFRLQLSGLRVCLIPVFGGPFSCGRDPDAGHRVRSEFDEILAGLGPKRPWSLSQGARCAPAPCRCDGETAYAYRKPGTLSSVSPLSWNMQATHLWR